MNPPVNYSDYLNLPSLLASQQPRSGSPSALPAHDEMLFIIIHQSYELWFKQLLFEVDSVIQILQKPTLADPSPELEQVVHRLSRCVTILKSLVQQIDILETMEPMDFLDFRDFLRPASGFQSWQFKMLEARLGLRFQDRYGKEHYLSQLQPAQVEMVQQAEARPSLWALVHQWLERMPFFEDADYWPGEETIELQSNENHLVGVHPFWIRYRRNLQGSLAPAEMANLEGFDERVLGIQSQPTADLSRLSPRSSQSALFIMLYRGYPLLQLPFQLLEQLLNIDEGLSTWRYRHMHMVSRIIGTRIGTGGSSGGAYLKAALERHAIFPDLARLTSYLVQRSRRPALGQALESRLGVGR